MGACAGRTSAEQKDGGPVLKPGVQEDFHINYSLLGCLGGGAYGTVYLSNRRGSDEEWAVKIVAMRGPEAAEQRSATTVQTWKEVLDEKIAWTRAGHHPNIVSLQEWYVDSRFAYFVMNRCNCTLLCALMNEPVLSEYTYAGYFKEMAAALEHIHSLGVVHRDVKHDNFLMGGESGRTVKLCDFGLSAVVTKDRQLSHGCGTAPYMAPEMVTPRATHGAAVDVWSLGVIAYMSFFGSWPYTPKDRNAKAMKKEIREGIRPPSFMPPKSARQKAVSDVAARFVRVLLDRDQTKRPSATECLAIDYLCNSETHATKAAARGLVNVDLMPMLHRLLSSGKLSTCQAKASADEECVLVEMQTKAYTKLASTTLLETDDTRASLADQGSKETSFVGSKESSFVGSKESSFVGSKESSFVMGGREDKIVVLLSL